MMSCVWDREGRPGPVVRQLLFEEPKEENKEKPGFIELAFGQ